MYATRVESMCNMCSHTHPNLPTTKSAKNHKVFPIARPIKKPQSFLCKVACAHCLLSRAQGDDYLLDLQLYIARFSR